MSRVALLAALRRGALGHASRVALSLGFLTAMVAAGAGGCTTEAFCFHDCGTTSSSSGMATGTGGHGGGCLVNCSTGTTSFVTVGSGGSGTGGTGTGGTCDPTQKASCGTCNTNCYAVPNSNWDPATVTCDPGPHPGMVPGTCSGKCAPDYWNLSGPPSDLCNYYCVKTAAANTTCDGIDHACTGVPNDAVDFCKSPTDCGACGNTCSVTHGTPQCAHTDANPTCTAANTQCQIAKCDCNGPGDCWWDVDKSYATGCEYKCDKTNNGVELCDGIDNDCSGVADDNLQDPAVGVPCFGAAKGVCADPAHAGVTQCVGGQVKCLGPNVIVPGQIPETCNNLDDDCNGVVDDNPIDVGPAFVCGVSSVLPCQKGILQCQAGMKVCVNNIDPKPETCNGIDDDCDGIIDDNLPPAQNGAACNVPTPPPAGATSPCMAGATQCINGAVNCVGSVGPVSATDSCGVDANCNGQLTGQPDLTSDVNNCGACGHACKSPMDHSIWSCQNSACVFGGCFPGYYDIPANHLCSYPCIFTSAVELCNGVDDNCNGQIDENVPAPSVGSVCGINPGATTPECTNGVTVACVAGKYQCTFATPGVCNPSCAQAAEVCDGLDNNCNGLVDENVPNVGQPCASDTGKPPPGDGVCRTSGTYVCSGPNAVACNAVKDLTKAGPEICDGIDNDCDGLVDEPFTNKGSNAMYFVKPVVTQVQANPGLWIYTYESSRPGATGITAGNGNGYTCNQSPCNNHAMTGTLPVAPAGVTLDKTASCSVQGKIPWFDVSPIEVEQTCDAMGGHVCSPAEWQTACFAKLQPTPSCTWGYASAGAACTSSFTAGSKFCNLGMSYDFDPSTPGMQNGLLPTGSPKLMSCFADWTGTFTNVAGTNDQIFDITGNLREITKAATNQYTLMGGAFDNASEAGAACNFTFYNVDQTFKLLDTGFRCCFSQDPTL